MRSDAIAVVRDYIGPYSGEEFGPVIEGIARMYEAGGIDAVREQLPEIVDLVHPDVEWRMDPIGTFRGHAGLLDFWREWAAIWESYVYTVRTYEHVGRYVLTT